MNNVNQKLVRFMFKAKFFRKTFNVYLLLPTIFRKKSGRTQLVAGVKLLLRSDPTDMPSYLLITYGYLKRKTNDLLTRILIMAKTITEKPSILSFYC